MGNVLCFMFGIFLTILSVTWLAVFILGFTSNKEQWGGITILAVVIVAGIMTAGITLITH